MTDEKEMELLVEKIASRLEKQLDVYIASQDEMCRARKKILDEHHKTLYGNSHRGLKATMARVCVYLSIIGFISGATFIALAGALLTKLFN